jgi:hypothetical protein
MYFWLFLNIASDDTKSLFAALISPPEGGGGGSGVDGVATPLPLLLEGLLVPVRWFFSLESKNSLQV